MWDEWLSNGGMCVGHAPCNGCWKEEQQAKEGVAPLPLILKKNINIPCDGQQLNSMQVCLVVRVHSI